MAIAEDDTLVHAGLKTPKAAAVAGIVFSLLMFTIFALLRPSIPDDPLDSGAWLVSNTRTIALALNLVPFAGVAFLWSIGVLRDRLDRQEDRFFATVFLGSALLFLSMLFVAAAVTGAVMLVASVADPDEISSATFRFARAATYILINVYATKMAAVFMVTTSTLVIYTAIAPRWIALIGYALALLLLVGSYHIGWSFAILPAWVLLISVHILADNLRRR
ncbi:MAG TPA: hypothetical protein VFQ87_13445 [Bradyrhizobium sp.]|nr:hypothetical protein [Bradyrhizobium sp.]